MKSKVGQLMNALYAMQKALASMAEAILVSAESVRNEATQQNVPMAKIAAASARPLEQQGQGLVRTASVYRRN